MVCVYLKYNCSGASVVCRTATKDLLDVEKREACPNSENPYVISPKCWEVEKIEKPKKDFNQYIQKINYKHKTPAVHFSRNNVVPECGKLQENCGIVLKLSNDISDVTCFNCKRTSAFLISQR